MATKTTHFTGYLTGNGDTMVLAKVMTPKIIDKQKYLYDCFPNVPSNKRFRFTIKVKATPLKAEKEDFTKCQSCPYRW